MTIPQLLEAARAELTDLMASRKDNPAMTLGHACKLLRLFAAIEREHATQERWIGIANLADERPANEC